MNKHVDIQVISNVFYLSDIEQSDVSIMYPKLFSKYSMILRAVATIGV